MDALDNQVLPNSAAAALIGDPSKFGRVDENGMVYVRTNDGEKVVGSYPGKSAEEALAYFVRKLNLLPQKLLSLLRESSVALWFLKMPMRRLRS